MIRERKILSEKRKEKEEPRFDVVCEETPLAVHDHICPKCGHDKAQLIECGVWIGDEDNVIKYKCGKCGYVDDISEKPI